jgi:hypothetical protein
MYHTGSVEIARSTFGALALVAFSDIFDLAVFEEGFHVDLTSARAIEMMGGT